MGKKGRTVLAWLGVGNEKALLVQTRSFGYLILGCQAFMTKSVMYEYGHCAFHAP